MSVPALTSASMVRRAGVAALVACGLIVLNLVVAIAQLDASIAIALSAAYGIALIGVAWGIHPTLVTLEPVWATGAFAVCVGAAVMRFALGGAEMLHLDDFRLPGDIIVLAFNGAWFGIVGVIAERGDLWPRYLSLYAQTASVGYILGVIGLVSGRISANGLPSVVLGVFGIAFLARFGFLASRGRLVSPAGHG